MFIPKLPSVHQPSGGRETKLKLELDGYRHIRQAAVNTYYIISHNRQHCNNIAAALPLPEPAQGRLTTR